MWALSIIGNESSLPLCCLDIWSCGGFCSMSYSGLTYEPSAVPRSSTPQTWPRQRSPPLPPRTSPRKSSSRWRHRLPRYNHHAFLLLPILSSFTLLLLFFFHLPRPQVTKVAKIAYRVLNLCGLATFDMIVQVWVVMGSLDKTAIR